MFDSRLQYPGEDPFFEVSELASVSWLDFGSVVAAGAGQSWGLPVRHLVSLPSMDIFADLILSLYVQAVDLHYWGTDDFEASASACF